MVLTRSCSAAVSWQFNEEVDGWRTFGIFPAVFFAFSNVLLITSRSRTAPTARRTGESWLGCAALGISTVASKLLHTT